MNSGEPETTLDSRFSTAGASVMPWVEAIRILDSAKIYWLTTVRPDGRPHMTPLIAVWHADSIYFCTGAAERKAKNLAENAHCIVSTGCNAYDSGSDIVVEGEAERVTDQHRLQPVADQYLSKYGWEFAVRDGAFVGGEENVASVFRVAPKTAFGFGREGSFTQTRWRF